MAEPDHHDPEGSECGVSAQIPLPVAWGQVVSGAVQFEVDSLPFRIDIQVDRPLAELN